MKRIVLFIIAAAVLSSCTFENDLFEAYKEAPMLSLNYKGQNFEGILDSLKVPSTEIGEKAIPFELRINDKSNVLSFSYEIIQGVGIIAIGNQQVASEVPQKISRGNHSAYYIPQRAGRHAVNLYVSDLYGNTTYRRLEFIVFTNLLPVAQFSINKIGQYSKYEIEIDASKSYDRDEKWGGRIEEYIFKVGSYYQLNTSEFMSIKHILPGSGTYVISLQVKDNDGALSEPIFQEITF